MSKESPNYFAKYIAYAPGDLVGRYANGDTIRTEALFRHLYKKNYMRHMDKAYDRERELMPNLLDMERHGIPVAHKKLGSDVELYKAWQSTIDLWIIKRLKCSADINLNSGAELVAAMLKAKAVDKVKLGVTPKTHKPKTDKESLIAAVKDKTLLAVLGYRTRLNTYLNTFMVPWLRMADASGGKIFTTWNQTKLEKGKGTAGTRTGRLSSTPNFQNAPKEPQAAFLEDLPKKEHKGSKLPKSPFKGLPALPDVRSYIIPSSPKHILIDRDYSQQELRVLAHFEGAKLMESYQSDPWMDIHEYARTMINNMMGKDFSRKVIKTTGFGIIYGQGVALLAERSGVDLETAREVKDAYLKMFPELKVMYQEMKKRRVCREPIRTWGGREVFCEPDMFSKEQNRWVQLDYKLVNYLIQGSSADCTKDAINAYYRVKPKHHHLILNIHDQITVDIPRTELKRGMEILRQAMEGVKFDVPMLSEGKWSATNWAKLTAYDKAGVIQ